MKLSHFVLLLILPLAALGPMMQLEDVALDDVDSQNEAAKSGGVVVINLDYDWKFTAGDYIRFDSASMGETVRLGMLSDPQWDRVVVNWVDDIRVDISADASCSFASYSGQCHIMTLAMGMNITAYNDTNNPTEQVTTNFSTVAEDLIPINYNII